MRRIDDVDSLLRLTYGFIRKHGSSTNRARAYYAWRRTLGPGKRTSFVAAADGTVWMNDRVALLAELRAIILRDFAVEVVRVFDRKV